MDITITNILIFLNSLISLKNTDIHNLIESYEYFKPYEFNIFKPLSLFIPYFYNNYLLSFLLNMIILNYIGTILEKYYEKVMYCKIIFLCFMLTSIYAFCLSLIFKNIFEYSLFYHSACCGFTPIIFALRTIYFNKLNRRMTVYGFKVHSKNIIWIEITLLNLLNPNQSFYINLAGILSGNSVYNILKN
tara:strand:- start:1721 stop:2287 length:567 start_codon:yes stop_codon:yes gene_type:complete